MARSSFDPTCGFDIASTTIRDPEALDRIAAWGYRVVQHESDTLFLHEAFYDADGALLGIAVVPTRACGDTAEKIREEIAWMAEGLDEPLLRLADFAPAQGRFDRYGWSNGEGGAPPSGPFRDN